MAGIKNVACRRGFTLVELVVSVSIISVLVGAMGSVILIAGRTVELSAATGNSAPVDVVARISADLQIALSISERTATAVTLIVPDRDGDGVVLE